MGLEQIEMESGLNKVDFAINLLQTWEPKDGYYLAFSGGKRSSVGLNRAPSLPKSVRGKKRSGTR